MPEPREPIPVSAEQPGELSVATGGSRLSVKAHALTVFRALPSGEGRAYTATTFPQNPHRGCERFVRMCRAVGWISETAKPYAVLDVLDANGDIVQDFSIPTALAFQRIKRRLDLRVETDSDRAPAVATKERSED